MTSGYSGINVDLRTKAKVSKSDIKNAQGASYVNDHNKTDEEYNELLEQRMKEYMSEASSLSDRHFNEFDTHVDEFGVFNNLGIENAVIGFDWGQDEEEMKKAHEKLLQSRKKDKKIKMVKELNTEEPKVHTIKKEKSENVAEELPTKSD
jgi:hypothetical protein